MDLIGHILRAREAAVRDQRGVMLIEVLVSAVLLIVLALATLAVMDRSSALSADNRARSAATLLGQQEVDQVRQLPFSAINDKFSGGTAVGTKVNVHASPVSKDIDGSGYLVQTELEVVEDNGIENTACLAGWQSRKIAVTTTVTPPNSRGVKPVTMKTFRVPTILDTTDKGGVIVQLSRGDGGPTVGVPVQVVGGESKTTSDDGCAVFNNVAPNSKVTVKWGQTGGTWVDENGAETVQRTFTLQAGSVAQFSDRVDVGKAPTVTFVDENGTGQTADGKDIVWNSVAAVQPGISTVYNGWRGWRFNGASHSFTLPKLFPFESPYGVIAGNCPGNDPTVWEPDPPTTANAIMLSASSPSNIKIMMQTVVFTLPGAGYRVYVAPETRVSKWGSGYAVNHCVGGDTLTDGILPASAPAARKAAPVKTSGDNAFLPVNQIQYALPWGVWRVCVEGPLGRYKLPVRINNTPVGTPGTAPNINGVFTPATAARTYKAYRNVNAQPALTIPSTAANWTGGATCGSDGRSAGWLDWNQSVDPTDPS